MSTHAEPAIRFACAVAPEQGEKEFFLREDWAVFPLDKSAGEDAKTIGGFVAHKPPIVPTSRRLVGTISHRRRQVPKEME